MNTNSRIKAVVFDLDGVYFESGTSNFVISLKRVYGLTQRQIEDVYLKSSEMKKFKHGEITSLDFWEFALQKWNVETTRNELIAMMLSSYNVREETQRYVENLRKLSVKTAICTNNFSDRIEGLKERFNLAKYFDSIVVSCEIGAAKPCAQIFNHLADKLNLMPNEIVMSDDKESNVVALQELGFEAFLYEDWEGFVDKTNKLLGTKPSVRNGS